MNCRPIEVERIAIPHLVLLLLLTIAFLVIPETAWAQQVTAAITGKVTDPSGGVIVGARVTAKDLDRGTVLQTATNDQGVYNLPRVPVGRYEIRAESQGFQTAIRPSLVLELNQTARVDFEMKVGEVTQTIEVSAAPPLLSTDTMQLGTVIDNKINEALPLATRNYIQLTLLAPGSTHPNPSTFTTGEGGFNSGRPYVNGNREQANNFLLDGLDNNQVSDNLVGYQPAPDAIQEFNMITNNAPAEFGNFQGGIISTSLKSGTNDIHGSAFEFFRNDVFNANTWENNWQGADKNKVRWNQFGGTIGGPIKKDKLFFFGDYSGERLNFPARTQTLSVFTDKERIGDFSELCTTGFTNGICNPATKPGDRSIQLYDPNPANYIPDPAHPGQMMRAPFLNNVIPLSRQNIVAGNLFSNTSLYPLPINDQLQNNQLNTQSDRVVGDQFDVKIDANLTEADKVFGRYSNSRQDHPLVNSFPLLFGSFSHTPIHNGVVDWTRTISPNLVNDARFGVNYVQVNNGGTDNGLGNVAEQLGILGVNDRGPGLLGLNFIGGFVNNNQGMQPAFGNANIGTQQLFPSTVIQAEDAIILTRSSHTIHTGFQFMRDRINPFYAGNYGRTGNIIFDGRWTAGPGAFSTAGAGTGSPEADFFLGLPEVVQRGVNTGTWGQRSSVFAGYVQDDWRTTKSLTFNVGLRYETHTPWVEVKDRQVNFAPFSGQIEVPGQSTLYSNDRALYNSYNWGIGNFQPRFGFAWNPEMMNKSLVVRGAYTVSSYLEGTGTNLRLPLNPPNNTEFNTVYDSLAYPASTLDQGLTVLQSATDPFANAVIRLWDPNIKPAIVQQWNFSVERQFGGSTTLTTGYIGQHGTHLMVPMPYFQRQLLGLDSSGTPITAPSPYLSGNPALADISQISGTESNGNQKYNALQATLRKRYSQGLQYQVAYTYSKCMTDSLGYYGVGGQVSTNSAYWQDLYNRKAEWGPCFFDVKHTLTSYAVYELPIGKGKSVGNDWSPVLRTVAGNWSVSGIVTLRGGFPSTITGPDSTGTNSRGMRADCNGPVTINGLSTNSPLGGLQYFDPSALSPAATGLFGTCGNGTLYGPGLRNLDLGLQKNFAFTERYRVELRSEFINLTNTPAFNAPDAVVGPTLGRITSTQGARQIQWALKFYF